MVFFFLDFLEDDLLKVNVLYQYYFFPLIQINIADNQCIDQK